MFSMPFLLPAFSRFRGYFGAPWDRRVWPHVPGDQWQSRPPGAQLVRLAQGMWKRIARGGTGLKIASSDVRPNKSFPFQPQCSACGLTADLSFNPLRPRTSTEATLRTRLNTLQPADNLRPSVIGQACCSPGPADPGRVAEEARRRPDRAPLTPAAAVPRAT
ncbi:hypothetical protein AAFF_G00423870 [Aldrovandia affinis]|uniref:Uncharacterized protein n=1 Tax=Aldrovandia affinis TaxID=143900 RepID=A0AAD7WZX9_9TELE|nr:hypothetical protein AAFF_G00423870 [Aldrovandia affinis]